MSQSVIEYKYNKTITQNLKGKKKCLAETNTKDSLEKSQMRNGRQSKSKWTKFKKECGTKTTHSMIKQSGTAPAVLMHYRKVTVTSPWKGKNEVSNSVWAKVIIEGEK